MPVSVFHLPNIVYSPADSGDTVLATTIIAPSSDELAIVLAITSWSTPLILIAKPNSAPNVQVASIDIIVTMWVVWVKTIVWLVPVISTKEAEAVEELVDLALELVTS